MKSAIAIFSMLMVFSFVSFAQDPSASPAPVVAASPAPVMSPTPIPNVVVAEPAAPPQWAQDILMNAEKLPVVGPYVAKAMLYLGILAALLTALVAFLLTVLSVISAVVGGAGMSNFAAQLQSFRDGKVMYWLKYLSMFNAQKPVSAPVDQASSSPSAVA